MGDNPNPNPSLTIPRDIIEPIIQSHVAAAITEALGLKKQLLSEIATRIINECVDSNGKPSSYSYDKGRRWIDWATQDAFRKAMQSAIEEQVELHKETLKKALVAELKKVNSPLVKAMVEGMVTGALTTNLCYNLTISEKKD